ncbi:MAG: hypothetical protein ABGZ17_15990, partial [Planctomycetaceae bacterium]
MFISSNNRVAQSTQTPNTTRRPGLALVMVLFAISTSLILTLSFLRTQNSVLHLSQNARHQDLALQAARTGVSSALHDLQSPTWSGVEQILQQTLADNDEGLTRFTVEYLPLSADEYPNTRYHRSLYLVLRSTGSWHAHADDRVVRKSVEILIELRPRLSVQADTEPGMQSGLDVADNSQNFDQIRTMALFAEGGRTSLRLGPAHRIEGHVWIFNALHLFKGPQWNNRVRSAVMHSIGNRLNISPEQSLHPHPLSGQVTHFRSLSSATKAGLKRLKIPSVRATSRLRPPTINLTTQQSYSMYQGGPTYEAVQLQSVLENIELIPTPDNPLGLFYRHGSLIIRDNVTVRGSLMVNRKLTIEGRDVHLCSFDWRGIDGESQVPDIENWPRLPAIVANSVLIDRDVRLIIEGAVISDGSFDIRAGDLDRHDVPLIDIEGLAV